MNRQHRDPIELGVVEVEERAGGISRITQGRTVTATCANCGREFTNSGTAASHARGARHRVDVRYAVSFTFQPNETGEPDGGAE